MIDKAFIDNLKPVELELISSYIYDLIRKKVTPDTSNYENIEVKCCPICGSVHFVKNGHDFKGNQKYMCRDCHICFTSTTGTIFHRSRISYNDWTSFIACELVGMSLEAESVAISRSINTCFSMRHKLYQAIEELMDNTLGGLIELDPTYESINLKGTKPHNMPRYSKKRGKNNSHNSLRGISHHDICIIAAVDEYDHILLKIAGLGIENKDKLEQFSSYFDNGSTIISDNKPCIINFAKGNYLKSDYIPTLGGKKRYRTDKGNSLSSVNQLHQEIQILKYSKRGVSTRHLPGYLNWIIFKKKIRYQYESRNRKPEAYMKIMGLSKPFINEEISLISQPIDLYKAYGEYRYGIFSEGNPYPADMYDETGLLNPEYNIKNNHKTKRLRINQLLS